MSIVRHNQPQLTRVFPHDGNSRYIIPPGRRAFSPKDLFDGTRPGLFLDMERGVFADAAGTIPAKPGDEVLLIRDQSPNGNDVTAAKGTAPIYCRYPTDGVQGRPDEVRNGPFDVTRRGVRTVYGITQNAAGTARMTGAATIDYTTHDQSFGGGAIYRVPSGEAGTVASVHNGTQPAFDYVAPSGAGNAKIGYRARHNINNQIAAADVTQGEKNGYGSIFGNTNDDPAIGGVKVSIQNDDESGQSFQNNLTVGNMDMGQPYVMANHLGSSVFHGILHAVVHVGGIYENPRFDPGPLTVALFRWLAARTIKGPLPDIPHSTPPVAVIYGPFLDKPSKTTYWLRGNKLDADIGFSIDKDPTDPELWVPLREDGEPAPPPDGVSKAAWARLQVQSQGVLPDAE